MSSDVYYTIDLDIDADVLYVTLGLAVPCYVDELPNGLLLRRAMFSDSEEDSKCGVTLLGFSSWKNKLIQLAEMISIELDLSTNEIHKKLIQITN